MMDNILKIVDICVYVVEKTPDMEYLRNTFLTYIGGQRNVQCSEHNLPLIVMKNSSDKCYIRGNGIG